MTWYDIPVEKDDFDVHVLSVLVEKVLEEMGDGLVRYVTTHHDVPDSVNNQQNSH